MDAIVQAELKRLRDIKVHIERIANEMGLIFKEQKFDIVSVDRMLEMGAYSLLVNYSHWSFGRNYERMRTQYEQSGHGTPFEVVYNLDPRRAYILKTDPVALKITTMAHVYPHNDFYTKSVYYRDTWENVLTVASSARERFLKYEAQYGIEAVENTIEAFHSIQTHVDPDLGRRYDDAPDEKEEGSPVFQEPVDPFRKAFPKKKQEIKKVDLLKSLYRVPEVDIVYFLLKHAPLQKFQQDIGSVIWQIGREATPFWRTGVMNEGWAGFWHRRIMQRLLEEHLIAQEEYAAYLVWDSRVFANHPLGFNPYLIGRAIWQSIEDRWNKGKFGDEWEQCRDAYDKEHWDKKLGLGHQKLFEVREKYSDRFFIEHFLTQEIIDDLKLYIYGYDPDTNEIDVLEDDWEVIKGMLVMLYTNFGIPYMEVADDDLLRTKGILVLKHFFGGLALDEEYSKKTLEHIFFLWQRPVFLKTKSIGERGPFCVTYAYGNKGHRKDENCKSGHCRH